jgi:enoyl-CoA hydratase/carnithine racemase
MSMVLSEQQGSVAILTLNNPEQYNALSLQMLAELRTELRAVQADSGVRAIMLTGAGKGFCSGAQFGGDLFDRGEAVGALIRETVNPIFEQMRHSPIPIVVAVNGPAAGAGVGLALAGDIVLAAHSARFVLSFARLGAALDAGTSASLQRAIGVPRARALALLGEPLAAETAAQWGLIWKCVEDDALTHEAMDLAQKLARGPAVSLGLIKKQIEIGWGSSLDEVLHNEAAAQASAFATEDLREGAAAFVQKRPPVFVGR